MEQLYDYLRTTCVILLLAPFFLSCEASEIALTDECISVSFSAGERTRMTSVQDTKINCIQTLVFHNGDIVAYGYSESGNQVEIKLQTGATYDCYVVANVSRSVCDLSGVAGESELMEKYSYLKDNSYANLQMIGMLTKEITKNETVSVPVSRFASMVTVSGISRRMNSPAYKKEEFKILELYLTNVNTICPYTLVPEEAADYEWYNRCGYMPSQADAILHDRNIDTIVEDGSSYTGVRKFITYPNPSMSNSQGLPFTPRYTRLVLKASLAGVTYYYPVNIKGAGKDGTMESNNDYIVNLIVTGPGSDSDDVLTSNIIAEIQSGPADWSEGSTMNEQF